MPSSVYAAGAPGNVINNVTVGTSKTISAFLDLSTCIEGQVTCEMTTGSGGQPSAGTVFSVYKAYGAGSAAPITLTAAAASGANSLTVTGATAALHIGQILALQQSGGSKFGELVVISAISGSTLTLTTNLINSYSSGDGVYLIASAASFTVVPANSTGTWGASQDYSSEILLGPGQWVVAARNTDVTYPATVNVTCDRITAIA